MKSITISLNQLNRNIDNEILEKKLENFDELSNVKLKKTLLIRTKLNKLGLNLLNLCLLKIIVPQLTFILPRSDFVDIKFTDSYKFDDFGFVVQYSLMTIDQTVILAIHI